MNNDHHSQGRLKFDFQNGQVFRGCCCNRKLKIGNVWWIRTHISGRIWLYTCSKLKSGIEWSKSLEMLIFFIMLFQLVDMNSIAFALLSFLWKIFLPFSLYHLHTHIWMLEFGLFEIHLPKITSASKTFQIPD